ncbi:hypothetical protein OG250_29875 [Streptomyces sp. NBC_00487]|uniref:hypothetical protein n=1 Tax=unclassified Streptomyces TaxID=2593676 RepID=UPI002E16EC37|nr:MULTISPECIES: hypothetical protein [unclassified Streptomyces]
MAGELRYGDKVHIQNGYDNWQGGYLDANTGSSAGPTSVYQVATAATSNRSAGSGTWQISSVSGKQPGDAVLSGDTIHLRNLFGAGSYLDVSGGAAAAQTQAAIYDVSTNSSNDRVGAGTASWRILAKTSNPLDRAVRENDIVLLWSLYDVGGFLETNGGGPMPTEALIDVCTSAYWDRSNGNCGFWRLTRAQA